MANPIEHGRRIAAVDPNYPFGIEEEFFVSSMPGGNTVRRMPADFFAACEAALPGVVEPELLQSQIEVATPPCQSMAEARAALSRYRRTLGAVAADHGLAIIAAGTHPTALWSRQTSTDAARYDRLMKDLQMLGARNMVCGLHVHVGLPDPSRRAGVLTRLIPFLPLFFALSASSPFWQGRRTGLMAYRLAAYDELPRTGLPDAFESDADYRRYVDILVAAGAIPDASYIWWATRVSKAHPTLELRIADACTRLDDAIALAALFRALVRRIDRDDSINAGLGAVTRAIAVENKWRGQRYGVHGRFIDEARR
ncbi:MAG: carboxylate-amine ligase, partial [Methylobacteriaceae bacterium]|nr:carboxylate-amine ligase [Methylobacteriaceae bacterium]